MKHETELTTKPFFVRKSGDISGMSNGTYMFSIFERCPTGAVPSRIGEPAYI